MSSWIFSITESCPPTYMTIYKNLNIMMKITCKQAGAQNVRCFFYKKCVAAHFLKLKAQFLTMIPPITFVICFMNKVFKKIWMKSSSKLFENESLNRIGFKLQSSIRSCSSFLLNSIYFYIFFSLCKDER